MAINYDISRFNCVVSGEVMVATAGYHSIPSYSVKPFVRKYGTYADYKDIIGRACTHPERRLTLHVSGVEYQVSCGGGKLTVEHTSAVRWVLAKFLFYGRGVQKQFAADLQQYQCELKSITPQSNEGFRVHHPNVMSIAELTEHIPNTDSRILVAFDVDDTLTRGVNASDGRETYIAVEAQTLFKQVVEEIKRKAPNAQILLLTNGQETKNKLTAAGIELPEDVEISEPLTPERYSEQLDGLPQGVIFGLYTQSLHKGERLKAYLNERSSEPPIESVHFIDDRPGSLNEVAQGIDGLHVECHTYDYILTAFLGNTNVANDENERRVIARNVLQLRG